MFYSPEDFVIFKSIQFNSIKLNYRHAGSVLATAGVDHVTILLLDCCWELGSFCSSRLSKLSGKNCHIV